MSIPLIYQEDVTETFWVKRTERIYVPYNETYSYFCHLSKNVWNQAQYIVMKEYNEFGHVPSYEDVDKILNDINYYDSQDLDNYHKLSTKTSQQTIKTHNDAWKSYLVAIADYYKNPDKDYTGKPNKPGYKKKDGEFILIFTNGQCKIRNGYLIFPKKSMAYDAESKKWLRFSKIKVRFDDSYTGDGFDLYGNGDYGNCTKDGDDKKNLKEKKNLKLQEVRIIPQGVGYIVEIVYEKELIRNKYDLDPKRIIGIDLGVENVTAIVDNIGLRPIIIKGDILKSINQWYNKRKAELQAIYDRDILGCFLKRDKNGNIRYLTKKTGHKIEILTDNRNKSVMDIMHKLSRYIVDHALFMKAKTIAIGRNPLWKQEIKLGKSNNQNFVNIPHAKLIDMVKYKGEEVGIDVLDPEEDYTSKCSFLDDEELCHHDSYIGKRIYRGLFRSSKGILINADVQGAYNMIRKVDPKFNVNNIMEGVEAHGLVPKRLNVSDLM